MFIKSLNLLSDLTTPLLMAGGTIVSRVGAKFFSDRKNNPYFKKIYGIYDSLNANCPRVVRFFTVTIPENSPACIYGFISSYNINPSILLSDPKLILIMLFFTLPATQIAEFARMIAAKCLEGPFGKTGANFIAPRDMYA